MVISFLTENIFSHYKYEPVREITALFLSEKYKLRGEMAVILNVNAVLMY
jgi:hypothetical protein